MSDPKRLLSGSASDLERDLLRSAELLDVAPSDGKNRAYALLGGVTGAGGAGGASGAGGAATAKVGGASGLVSGSMAPKAAGVGVAAFAKWIAVPAVIGAVAFGGARVPAAIRALRSPEPTQATANPVGVSPRPTADATAAATGTATVAAPSIETPIVARVPIAASARVSNDGAASGVVANATRTDSRAARSKSSVSASASQSTAQPVSAASTSSATSSSAVADNAGTAGNPAPDTLTSSAVSVSELQQQMALLDRARDQLQSNHAAEALRALDAYDARFAKGGLAQEAEVLRMQALFANGDRAAASALARQFLAANPTSSHADIVRSLLQQNASTSP